VTPEAVAQGGYRSLNLPIIDIMPDQLRQAWAELNGAPTGPVQLVSLGNPHFSVNEIAALARLCRGRIKHPDVALIVTCGRHVLESARAVGDVAPLEEFGATFVTDTCWCMITEPLIPPSAKVIMTNSGKYAHYGPGLSGREMRFGSLGACVEAAVRGSDTDRLPPWLS
jgi:predicted aconitase